GGPGQSNVTVSPGAIRSAGGSALFHALWRAPSTAVVCDWMQPVRFGIRIPPCADARAAAACARDAEAAGFDVAWFPDSQLLWRDVYAAMALAAGRTERIVLGT